MRTPRLIPDASPFEADQFRKQHLEPAARKRTIVDHTFGATANVEERVRHRLGVLVQGFTVLSKSAACDIYRGTRFSDRHWIGLKSTVGGITVRLEFF